MPPLPLIFRENQQHVLDWIAHNPIFETTNKVKREFLKNNQGEIVCMAGVPVDARRGYQEIKENVWQQGDHLTMSGPMLCEQDAKSYLTCLYLLEQSEKIFSSMSITVTAIDFMEALTLTPSRENWKDSQRSLVRLAKAHIYYKLRTGSSYGGPLSYLSYTPISSIDGVYSIFFDESVTPRFSSIRKGQSKTLFQERRHRRVV